ncbi:DUF2189 domain-containing protein [Roseomonas sp. NAR14]|uniref:DUF2189 domain-containing protein n=1 Tax=Roseomonas acroporae TaxID=2937791 RepID=A0A9X1Y993_9PROT|nr:DUF2189 domain-containing protein [Roseomonas acroporae]MCK8784670.1 DUF2189 domain-containing protein [Roseomonas acroporae]
MERIPYAAGGPPAAAGPAPTRGAVPAPPARTPALAPSGAALPVRRIGLADLREALRQGLDDFRAHPTHAAFVALIYPVIGLVLGRMTYGAEVLPLLWPLVAGFALLGPVAAIGLYELSRRRERGLSSSWWNAFDVLRSPAIGSIVALGLVLMALFLLWLRSALGLYGMVFDGARPASLSALAQQVLTTAPGWRLLILGNGIGFLFAAVALMLGAVSFPLLLDRDVGVESAVRTSIRAVTGNPVPMAAWGLIVASLLLLGSVPFFLGLAVVLPLLGHATWHLYRRLVP